VCQLAVDDKQGQTKTDRSPRQHEIGPNNLIIIIIIIHKLGLSLLAIRASTKAWPKYHAERRLMVGGFRGKGGGGFIFYLLTNTTHHFTYQSVQ
jgi:hypothetical protein